MGKKASLVAGVVVVVVAITGFLFVSNDRKSTKADSRSTISTSPDDQIGDEPLADYRERLAKALAEKGAVLYGTYWCRYCKQQKELFGDAVKYLDYVECDSSGEDANPQECKLQDIKGYPTWLYQGQKYSGVQSLSDLAKMINFFDESSQAGDNFNLPEENIVSPQS